MANHRGKLLSGEKVVLPALVAAANALSLYALSMEVWTYAGSASGKSMGLTMLWAAYGIVLVVVGILGKWAWVRLGGLALVSVAVLKLFILDTLILDHRYRVAAYITRWSSPARGWVRLPPLRRRHQRIHHGPAGERGWCCPEVTRPGCEPGRRGRGGMRGHR